MGLAQAQAPGKQYPNIQRILHIISHQNVQNILKKVGADLTGHGDVEAKLKVFPKPDEIVIFPGHVTHEVPKAIDMIGERIILAGNIYLDYRNI